MQCLWERLAKEWPIDEIEALFCEDIGPRAWGWLCENGATARAPLQDGSRYPCPENPIFGCARRLLVAESETSAWCMRQPGQCDPIRFEEHPYSIRIDEETLAPLLRELFGLSRHRLVQKFGVVHLGERGFGERRVDFLFVPRPALADLESLFERQRERHRGTVAILFTRDALPPQSSWADAVYWLALSDALDQPQRTSVDRLALWDYFAPGEDAGEEFWPPIRFAVNTSTGEVRYEGQLVALDSGSAAWRLLVALLSFPKQVVRYETLVPSVCGVAHPTDRHGQLKPSAIKALRTAKSNLCAVFAGLGVQELVSTELARAGSEGGYRIAVEREQIRLFPRPLGLQIPTGSTQPHL